MRPMTRLRRSANFRVRLLKELRTRSACDPCAVSRLFRPSGTKPTCYEANNFQLIIATKSVHRASARMAQRTTRLSEWE